MSREIVVNKCYGGFGLSFEAEQMYAEKKGFEIFTYVERDIGNQTYDRIKKPRSKDWMYFTFTKDHGPVMEGWPDDNTSGYFYSRDIERDDPVLVDVVKTLGESASSDLSKLEIVEIPDDVSWHISEYDGIEEVAEDHRTW